MAGFRIGVLGVFLVEIGAAVRIERKLVGVPVPLEELNVRGGDADEFFTKKLCLPVPIATCASIDLAIMQAALLQMIRRKQYLTLEECRAYVQARGLRLFQEWITLQDRASRVPSNPQRS